MSTRATQSPMTMTLPELYQDDEAFARIRTLQKKLILSGASFQYKDLEKLTKRYNQAFEYSSLAITEAEQMQTIEILENLQPIAWHVIQTSAQTALKPPQASGQTSATESNRLAEKKQSPIKFDGLDYKSFLKRTLLTVDTQQDYIINKVQEIIAPRSWGKPLSKEYSQYQRFVEEKYSRVSWDFTVGAVCFISFWVLFGGITLYFVRG